MRLRIMKDQLTTTANSPVLKNCTSGVIPVNVHMIRLYKEVRGSEVAQYIKRSKSGIVASKFNGKNALSSRVVPTNVCP